MLRTEKKTLSKNFERIWYEFRCACIVEVPYVLEGINPLPEPLGSIRASHQPVYYKKIVLSHLLKNDGGDLCRGSSTMEGRL